MLKVRTVYSLVCNRLLEPAGLTGDSGVTDADFLGFLADTIRSFLQDTEILRDVEFIRADAFVTRYQLGANALGAHEVFYDLECLERTTAADMPRRVNWQDEIDRPKAWHDDRVEQDQIEVVPAPHFQGAELPVSPTLADGETNIAVIESVLPDLSALTLDSTIAGIPRSFGWYIAWGVLWRIFSGDTLIKDPVRAAYAKARFDEGVGLAKTVMGDTE